MSDKEMPTTGDPRVDQVVRENFVEAIGVTRQIIMDLAPGTDPQIADKIAALVPVQIWPFMANVVIAGVKLGGEQPT